MFNLVGKKVLTKFIDNVDIEWELFLADHSKGMFMFKFDDGMELWYPMSSIFSMQEVK